MEDSPELFNLLGNALSTLEKAKELLSLRFVFEFRLLFLQGVLPKELQNQTAILSLTVQEHENLNKVLPNFQALSP